MQTQSMLNASNRRLLKKAAAVETAADRRAVQTARMVALDKKLDSLHARLLTGGKAPDGGTLNFYTLNGKAVIVHEYPDNDGYEVYTPIVDTIAVDATFAALDRIANPQPTAADRGAARGVVNDPLWTAEQTPTCEQCGEAYSNEHDCTSGDHSYTAHSGRDDEGIM